VTWRGALVTFVGEMMEETNEPKLAVACGAVVVPGAAVTAFVPVVVGAGAGAAAEEEDAGEFDAMNSQSSFTVLRVPERR